MAKVRVHELAKQTGLTSKEMLALLQKAGIDVKTASSGVSDDIAEKVIKAVSRPVGMRAAASAKQQGKPVGGQGGCALPLRCCWPRSPRWPRRGRQAPTA